MYKRICIQIKGKQTAGTSHLTVGNVGTGFQVL
jgi:hypothetical protein